MTLTNSSKGRAYKALISPKENSGLIYMIYKFCALELIIAMKLLLTLALTSLAPLVVAQGKGPLGCLPER